MLVWVCKIQAFFQESRTEAYNEQLTVVSLRTQRDCVDGRPSALPVRRDTRARIDDNINDV